VKRTETHSPLGVEREYVQNLLNIRHIMIIDRLFIRAYTHCCRCFAVANGKKKEKMPTGGSQLLVGSPLALAENDSQQESDYYFLLCTITIAAVAVHSSHSHAL
jgi:hypothetical protein